MAESENQSNPATQNDADSDATQQKEVQTSERPATNPDAEKLSGAGTPNDDWHDVECKIQAYEMIAGWIRFADTKAAVILTVSGAAAGFVIPTIHKVIVDEESHLIPSWKPVVFSLFALYLLFFFLSNVAAFLCINPFRRKGVHPSLNHCDHFHPAAIANNYGDTEHERFGKACREGGSELMRGEVQTAILFDAHISKYKYGWVKISLRMFSISVLFGFLYYLFAQL